MTFSHHPAVRVYPIGDIPGRKSIRPARPYDEIGKHITMELPWLLSSHFPILQRRLSPKDASPVRGPEVSHHLRGPLLVNTGLPQNCHSAGRMKNSHPHKNVILRSPPKADDEESGGVGSLLPVLIDPATIVLHLSYSTFLGIKFKIQR